MVSILTYFFNMSRIDRDFTQKYSSDNLFRSFYKALFHFYFILFEGFSIY